MEKNGQTYSWDSRPSWFHFRKDASRRVVSGWGEVAAHVIFLAYVYPAAPDHLLPGYLCQKSARQNAWGYFRALYSVPFICASVRLL